MKSTSLAIVLFILFMQVICCKAQLSAQPDTNAIISLNEKAWKLRNSDLEGSKKFALDAVSSAGKINYIRGLSNSYNVLGYYYKTKSNYDSASMHYNKSLVLREKMHDTLLIARSYRNLMSIDKLLGKNKEGIEKGLLAIRLLANRLTKADAFKENAWLHVNLAPLYLKIGDYKNAMKNAFEAREAFDFNKDEDGASAAATNLGNIYERLREYDKALLEFKKAIKINSASDNQRELAKAYSNLGNIYYDMDLYREALVNYKKGLAIRQLNGYDDDIPGSLYLIGSIYKSQSQNDSALRYFDTSLALSEQSGNAEGQYETHLAMGSILKDQKKFGKALGHLQKSLSMSKDAGSLPDVLLLLKEISNTYKIFGQSDSALLYSDQYTLLSDSLNEMLRSSMAYELKIKEKEFEIKKGESDIKDREQKIFLRDQKNSAQKKVIIALFVVIILMGVILVLFLKSFNTKRRMLQLQQLIKHQELLAVDAMIAGQETERKRLATELHDTIGSILSAAKYAFKSMEHSLTKLLNENTIQYQKINGMLDEALETVRRISHDMASGASLEKGISDALHQLCDTLQKTGRIRIRLNLFGFTEKIDAGIELNLYRIVQELLTNILKHANAQNVSIQLIQSKDNINLVVEDDGKGFDKDKSQSRPGIGLSNIGKRVKDLSGKWDIDSGKGQGTTIVVDIPLNDK